VNGSIVYTLPAPNSVKLVITRLTSSTFSVLSALCTHQGTVLNPYNSSKGYIYCPLHFSRFGIDGHVIMGPATSPLKSYSSTYDASTNSLTITDSTLTSSTADTNESGNDKLTLNQNYPNPFTGKTTISFTTPERGVVSLTITDETGRQIAVPYSGTAEVGEHQIEFDGSHLSSGIYFCRLSTANGTLVKQMVKN
jgi:nitrite reductase/ring-hydroxylating ferredoxin subunit